MGEFKMPSLGADMEKGTLVAWNVKPGDQREARRDHRGGRDGQGRVRHRVLRGRSDRKAARRVGKQGPRRHGARDCAWRRRRSGSSRRALRGTRTHADSRAGSNARASARESFAAGAEDRRRARRGSHHREGQRPRRRDRACRRRAGRCRHENRATRTCSHSRRDARKVPGRHAPRDRRRDGAIEPRYPPLLSPDAHRHDARAALARGGERQALDQRPASARRAHAKGRRTRTQGRAGAQRLLDQ